MTIQELLKLESGTKGVNVEGKISGVWPVKTSPYGPSQFLLITDGENTVGVQTKTTNYNDSVKGADAEIVGALWRSYESKGKTQFVLDVPNNKISRITLKENSTVSATGVVKNVEEVKDKIFNNYKEAIIRAMELLNDEIVSQMQVMTKEKGWSTENITAVAASLFIEANRKL